MVAYNFQPEFVAPIQSGVKTQTIRRSARCKTGDELQLFTGQRTKACRQIGTATCAICEPITIADDYISVGMFRLPSGDAAHMAKIDGPEPLIELARAPARSAACMTSMAPGISAARAGVTTSSTTQPASNPRSPA